MVTKKAVFFFVLACGSAHACETGKAQTEKPEHPRVSESKRVLARRALVAAARLEQRRAFEQQQKNWREAGDGLILSESPSSCRSPRFDSFDLP